MSKGSRTSRRSTWKASVAGGALLALAGGPALAQATGSAAPVVLDTVVVQGAGSGTQAPRTGTVGQPPAPYAGGQVATGARLGALGNRSIFDAPFSVSGFTDELARDQQARSVADVVLNDPSVRSDAPAFSERDSFLIRGFSVVNLDTPMTGCSTSPIRAATSSKASSGSRCSRDRRRSSTAASGVSAARSTSCRSARPTRR